MIKKIKIKVALALLSISPNDLIGTTDRVIRGQFMGSIIIVAKIRIK